MVKFSLTLPSGLSVSFEGDDDGFARFTSFLTGDFQSLAEQLVAEPAPVLGGTTTEQLTLENGSPQVDARPLDARAIHDQLESVGAANDQERITVMAQAAEDAGLPGLDYETVDRIYIDLGLKKPGVWRTLFFNAKTRGYVRSVGPGLWKPTVAGQNFARLGHRIPARRKVTR